MKTKLDAVNLMLQHIGESAVESLDAGLSEVVLALSVLNEVNREVQSHEWNFNREYEVKLVKDNNHFIYVPANTLRVDATYKYKDVVQRGNRLYDKCKHSYEFTDLKEPLCVDLTVELDYEELPPPAADYIATRAARVLQRRQFGSEKIDAFIQEEEARAFNLLKNYDTDTGDYNIFDNPMFYPLWRQE